MAQSSRRSHGGNLPQNRSTGFACGSSGWNESVSLAMRSNHLSQFRQKSTVGKIVPESLVFLSGYRSASVAQGAWSTSPIDRYPSAPIPLAAVFADSVTLRTLELRADLNERSATRWTGWTRLTFRGGVFRGSFMRHAATPTRFQLRGALSDADSLQEEIRRLSHHEEGLTLDRI